MMGKITAKNPLFLGKACGDLRFASGFYMIFPFGFNLKFCVKEKCFGNCSRFIMGMGGIFL